MNSMNDFKVGDLVYKTITSTTWNSRSRDKLRTKAVHIGTITVVREKTCDVEFKPGEKPMCCVKRILKRVKDGA